MNKVTLKVDIETFESLNVIRGLLNREIDELKKAPKTFHRDFHMERLENANKMTMHLFELVEEEIQPEYMKLDGGWKAND